MSILGSLFKPNPQRLKEAGDVDGLLRALMYKKDPEVRFAAVVALGELKESKAIAPLMTALRDSSPKVRASAAAALGELRADEAVDALAGRLADAGEDGKVRAFVAANLQKIGGDRANRALLEYKKNHCARCGTSFTRMAQPLRRGFDFADAVSNAARVLASPGRECKCGAIICMGCLPMGGGSLSCPSCGSSL